MAAEESPYPKHIDIRGLENLTSAKMQALRTGRLENAVEEMTMIILEIAVCPII